MSKNLWDNAKDYEPEDGEYVDTDEDDLDDEEERSLDLEKTPR